MKLKSVRSGPSRSTQTTFREKDNDGVDDEIKREEADEDAINSDLDDPDEVDIADDDDEEKRSLDEDTGPMSLSTLIKQNHGAI